MANKQVVVIPGDDSAPQTVYAALEVIRALEAGVDFNQFPPGEEWVPGKTEKEAQGAIDSSDATLFGSTSGKTTSLNYLRWGKQTYANVRPCRYLPGFKSPLAHPEGIDFIIVRENMEDLYYRVEGPLGDLAPLHLYSGTLEHELDTSLKGKYAVKVITEYNTSRIAHFAFRLARRRKQQGRPGKVTCASKYNMLPQSDGLFREVVASIAPQYPDIAYEEFIIDDMARRIVQSPHHFDVVVMPNLYGDILSDAAAGTIGGLGLAPSGCYGDNYAYFESVHGTAPDIKGLGIINPTATMLSSALMLEYLGFEAAANRFRTAIEKVYAAGKVLTPDQGGNARTSEFTRAVIDAL